jgi:hypothetical protein
LEVGELITIQLEYIHLELRSDRQEGMIITDADAHMIIILHLHHLHEVVQTLLVLPVHEGRRPQPNPNQPLPIMCGINITITIAPIMLNKLHFLK